MSMSALPGIGMALVLLIGPIPAPARHAGEPSPGEPPASVDLNPSFHAWGLDPRPQGHRGTCSAFALTGALEYAVARQQSQGTRLSVEFLNWASNQATRTAADGGFFSDLWTGAESYGLCPEDDMPYAEAFDPRAQPSPAALAHAREFQALGLRLHWIKPWDPRRGLDATQFAAVKECLQNGWPVSGGFLWPIHEQWVDGVLQMAPRDAVHDGHSVLLVGYRDDPSQPGGGVFLIRNSAGPSRHGLISYEFVRAYMNDAVWIESTEKSADAEPVP